MLWRSFEIVSVRNEPMRWDWSRLCCVVALGGRCGQGRSGVTDVILAEI